ncbi:GNAT family N-acetyltransferase [Vibrio parahaemolyticus]|nr:GNAT family N-acetyltransferase [Vibrio parahaemolyticus]MDF4513929.1 GNAT family N-acetyltransferase [Vibrio parahaemolyticus]MDF5080147.1 GNAT family N-acetyltransferase [Vibrio parahaemolyticus]MDF5101068.1 GNAT family N-acetyltransferase [Vibrio parahaemolyticus]MDF5259566.1 GNAT family N-acetyltransferase [Vibrio parahaemolyticus]
MELVLPSIEFKAEFSAFYQDFSKNDTENAEYYRLGISNFKKYIQQLQDESKGLNLPDGYVPCDHFWLVDDKRNILGAIRVRHNIDNEFLALEAGHIGYDIAPSYRGMGYGKTMLKLVLPKAKLLGISEALITADEDNIASRKVIEANGGQFEKVVIGKVFPEPVARYWVVCE